MHSWNQRLFFGLNGPQMEISCDALFLCMIFKFEGLINAYSGRIGGKAGGFGGDGEVDSLHERKKNFD